MTRHPDEPLNLYRAARTYVLADGDPIVEGQLRATLGDLVVTEASERFDWAGRLTAARAALDAIEADVTAPRGPLDRLPHESHAEHAAFLAWITRGQPAESTGLGLNTKAVDTARAARRWRERAGEWEAQLARVELETFTTRVEGAAEEIAIALERCRAAIRASASGRISSAEAAALIGFARGL